MPDEKVKEGISLALSGGGFRATLFHIGALWRLNELGYLKKLKSISSVSGGSIISGFLGYKWKELDFDEQGSAKNYKEVISDPLCEFCDHKIDVSSILGGWLSVFKTPSDLLTSRYNEYLFHNATLQELPNDEDGPSFIIYATSLQTGVNVRFMRQYLSEYHLGYLPNPEIELATAVAASSAFPPVLTPLILKTKYSSWKQWKGADLFNEKYFHEVMYLSDGGVYDNLGLETAWDYETVLVSDAGAPFNVKKKPWLLKYSQLDKMLRVLDITIEQTRALRKRWLINKMIDKKRKGTYWGIATDIDDYKIDDPMTFDNDVTKSLQKISTRLSPFSKREQGYLINWGYALADAAMRRWVLEPGVPKGSWPVIDSPLN